MKHLLPYRINNRNETPVATMNIDAPITLEHKGFVNYAFQHWLDSLANGVSPTTLCLLGPPGIGKSSTAYAIQKLMTDHIRTHPELIFGTKSMPEAVRLLREECLAQATGAELEKLEARDFRVEQLEQQIKQTTSKSLLKELREELRQVEWNSNDIEALAELLDFSSKLPEDLGGLPFRNGDFVDYCPQRWVGKLCEKFAFGVYVQDDLPAAPQAMQVAGRQAALERRIHEHRFAPGILIIVTGNRREDKSSATTLPAHFRNSVTILAIEPSKDEWVKWYLRQPGVDPIVAAFLNWRPELLSQTPKESKDKLGAFATPRQWFNLGKQFQTADRCGKEFLLAISSGVVGAGNAMEFTAFVEIRNTLVPPEEVFDDPKKALPDVMKGLDDPSKRVAMATALGEIGAKRWKSTGKQKEDAPEKLLRSLAWCAQAGDEYSALGVQTFLDLGGSLPALARMARKGKTDDVIGKLLDHVKKALLGASD